LINFVLSHGCIVSSTALDFSSSQALQKYGSEHNLTSSSSIQLFQFVATQLQQQYMKRQTMMLALLIPNTTIPIQKLAAPFFLCPG
jgi:hypothetical protein